MIFPINFSKEPVLQFRLALFVWSLNHSKMAYVFVITPVSSNFFIESVRLRSIDKARFRLVFEVPSCLAISSKVSTCPFWACACLSPPLLNPHNLTYSTATFRCFESFFLFLPYSPHQKALIFNGKRHFIPLKMAYFRCIWSQ